MKPQRERERRDFNVFSFRGLSLCVSLHSTGDAAKAHRQTSTQTLTPQVCQGAGEGKCGRGSAP